MPSEVSRFIGIKSLIKKFAREIKNLIDIFCASIHIAVNLVFNKHTKHIKIEKK